MTDYTELKRLVDRVLTDRRFCGDENHKALADGVVALIAENERLQEAHEQICTNYNQVSYASEERGKQIDQLKAELEHTGYDHDLLRNERDQLKAENEALRAKLERPDPILIQSLDSAIADYELLEKNATRYQWLREARSGYIEVVEWIGPHAIGMTGEDLDALLDAAMSKGEQS